MNQQEVLFNLSGSIFIWIETINAMPLILKPGLKKKYFSLTLLSSPFPKMNDKNYTAFTFLRIFYHPRLFNFIRPGLNVASYMRRIELSN